MSPAADNSGRGANTALWIIQGLLAAVFLFAGGLKLIVPAAQMDQMAQQAHMPAAFLRFIGVCETLGVAGLILPGVFRIRTGLTALAAAGLVIIMIGAASFTAITGPLALAVIPFVIGLLAAFV